MGGEAGHKKCFDFELHAVESNSLAESRVAIDGVKKREGMNDLAITKTRERRLRCFNRARDVFARYLAIRSRDGYCPLRNIRSDPRLVERNHGVINLDAKIFLNII